MILSYRRCSTDDAQHGPQAQADRIEVWAKTHNFVIDHHFFDDGVSGGIPLAERPSGAAMLDMLKKGDGEKIVVVSKLDRIFRSVADAAFTLDAWTKAGIKLVALAEGVDVDNIYGRALVQVVSIFAELERKMIGARTREALNAKRQRGERIGSVPYGFDSVGGKLIQNPQEQAVIAQICTWRGLGLYIRRIADKLNREGVKAKKGGLWQPSAVARILQRSRPVQREECQ